MTKSFRIPRRGGSGVAFLGVELKDATILLASLFLGLFCGSTFEMGNTAYLGFPVGGYFVNRLYVDWHSKSAPGALRNFLFSKGIWGYTSAFKKQKTLFIGDGTGINKQTKKWLDGLYEKCKQGSANGSSIAK